MSSNILQFNTHADDKWAVLCEVRIAPDNARDPLIPQQPLRPEILLTYELCAAEEDPNSRVEDRLGV